MNIEEALKRALGLAMELLGRSITSEEREEVLGLNASGDITRKIDVLSEELIVAELRNSGIDAWMISEERGLYALTEEPKYYILVDPLDGSANYSRGIPIYSISAVAVERESASDLLKGALYGIAASSIGNMIFEYRRPGEILINGVPPAKFSEASNELLSFLFRSPGDLALLEKSVEEVGSSALVPKIRVLGSATIEAIYGALGYFRGFISTTGKLRNIDISLGLLMAHRLGRLICVDPPIVRGDGIQTVRTLVIGGGDDEIMKRFSDKVCGKKL